MANLLDGVIKVYADSTYAVELYSLVDHTIIDGDGYTVEMVVTDVSPNYGFIGDTITITGDHFGFTQGSSTVTICGVTPTVVSWSNTEIKVTLPGGMTPGNCLLEITVGGITYSESFCVIWGDVLRFVTYDFSKTGGVSGSIILDINEGVDYCFDEIEFPPPEPRIDWRDPAHGDGRDVSRYKFENREIHINMNVFGTSEADLSTNLRALWDVVLEDPPMVLEWRPDGWTDSLFFDVITPITEINPHDWFETWKRDYPQFEVLSNLELTMEALPFARGPEETVTLLTGGAGVSGIVVGPGSFKGDYPAPADIHIDLASGTLWTDLIFGQRLKYSAAFDPIQEPTVGTYHALATRLSGDYRSVATMTNLVLNSSFETYTGSGNTTNWGNWTESRSGLPYAYLGADTVFYCADGGIASAGLGTTTPGGTAAPWDEQIWSDGMAITDVTKAYYVGFWSQWNRYPDPYETANITVSVHFYDGGGSLGYKLIYSAPPTSQVWEWHDAFIYPADFPAGTTTAFISVRSSSTGTLGGPWHISIDGVFFSQIAQAVIQANYPLDSHEGRYLPACAASFGASTLVYDNLTLQAMLATSSGAEMTTSISPTVIDLGNPYPSFREIAMLPNRSNEISIPTHKVSGQADKSLLEQIIRLSADPLNGEDLWYDYIGIIPTDRAYSEVRGWSGNNHVILDGRSSQLALTSLTGSIDDAMIFDMTKQKGICSFVADPDGFNGTIVALVNDVNNWKVESIVDISMVYDPLYLLVPEA